LIYYWLRFRLYPELIEGVSIVQFLYVTWLLCGSRTKSKTTVRR